MNEEDRTLERIAKGDYLYLAHPRESKDVTRLWEIDFEKRSGIVLLNPFYEIDRENSDVDQNEKDPSKAHKILGPSTVKDELDFIEKGIGLIAIVDGAYTAGTFMEMVYAFKDFKKPVHSLVTNGYKNHPWITEHSSEIFTDRDKLEKRLIEKYGSK